MKIRIFYDAAGDIRSVCAVSRGAKATPAAPDYRCVEADLKELGADGLADVHRHFRVEQNGEVVRRARQDCD